MSRLDETWGEIRMDESIIPPNVDLSVEATNLDGATTEKKVVDKDLDKSKSKLAGILSRRKEKE